MIISYKTVSHPYIDKRNITLMFVDNKLDLPSARFLIHSARYGGRRGFIAGRESHRPKAIKLGELYRHLGEMGITWREATEFHIEAIRNAMLCWDKNDNEDYTNYEYKPLKRNTVNQKLDTWFNFYKYMDKIGEYNEMVLSTIRVRIPNSNGLLNHLSKRADNTPQYVDKWLLKVSPDPQKNKYHAISRTEYTHLEKHLKNDDLAYAMLAYLMVETGLRAAAALEISEKVFKHTFVHLNSGKSIDDAVEFLYISKGGDTKRCKLRIRTIQRIQKQYLSRELVKRKKLHRQRCNRLPNVDYNEDTMWLNKRGKPIDYRDILNAFKQASEKMGRTIDKITPHWMRHTFATWAFIDYAAENNIDIKNMTVNIDPGFALILQDLLGHASEHTQKMYLGSALDLLGTGRSKGAIMSLRGFKKDKNTQDLVRREALIEFGDDFDDDSFDVFKYAQKREIVVDDSWI